METPKIPIVVDSNETLPYSFELWRDKIILCRRALWAMGKHRIRIKGEEFDVGGADYSLDGFEDHIQIERKSANDLYSSLGGGRNRFEARMARLNECEIAFLVIETTWFNLLHDPPQYSKLNPNSIEGTHQSWSLRYPRVHWVACAHRVHAERFTFHVLRKFWESRNS